MEALNKFTKLFPSSKPVRVKELYKAENIKENVHLGRYEVNFYHFLEKNKDNAYTFWALIERLNEDKDIKPIPPMERIQDYDKIQKTLEKMVSEGKIKGVYAEGQYYYHFPP